MTEARPPLARAALAVAGASVLLHAVVNAVTPYGFHRDEFLYFAMGRHLRLWRMDFPPAIAILAELWRGVFGDGLVAIRMAPALAAGAVGVIAALLARELGGRRWAQTVAAVGIATSPLFLRAGNLYQPVVLDQLWWALGYWTLARLGATGDRRWWLAFGAAVGLGLLTKFSIAFFGVGVLAGVLLTDERRALATPWPWLGLALALAIGSPSIVGQVALGYPVLGQMRDLRSTQLARVGPGEFLASQALLGPAVLVATAGAAWLVRARAASRFRMLGWATLATFATLLVAHGKGYYVGPIYVPLLAAGATAAEQWSERVAARGALARLARVAMPALLVLYGAATFPFGVPILPPPAMARYGVAMGVSAATTTNTGAVEALPQDYADMLGWETLVRRVASAHAALPPADRARAVVLAGNYGEAGALDFYGPRYGLPRAVCPAGSYWFFGPGPLAGDVAVTLGADEGILRKFFGEVAVVGRGGDAYAVAEERNALVTVARRPVASLQAVWPSLAGRN